MECCNAQRFRMSRDQNRMAAMTRTAGILIG